MQRRAPGYDGAGEERVFALSTMQDLAAVAARPDLALAETLTATHTSPLDAAIGRATGNLLRRQQADGHWVFELEADATIPAEYVMLRRFFGRAATRRGRRGSAATSAASRRRRRRPARAAGRCSMAGRWTSPARVKAYFALRLIGDAEDAPHMRARPSAILAAGGAERCNVFTRATLALFGQVPWHAVPVMPPEIILLPRWFPFHLSKVSYWSRTVIAPLPGVARQAPPGRRNRASSRAASCSAPRPSGPALARQAAAAQPWERFFAQLDRELQPLEHMFPAASAPAPRPAGGASSPSGSTARTGSAPSFRPWPMPSWP